MTTQIAIIGLGQIGASFGLALAEQKENIHRIGFDFDRKRAKRAKKMGAVDKTAALLKNAVKESNLILLALPLDQIDEILEIVVPQMRIGAVLMDTAPAKQKTAQRVSEMLPENCHYVGLTAVINPKYLHTNETGVDAAQADLFQNMPMAISALPSTSTETIELVVGLVHLIGASPLFTGLLEIDGFMTTTDIVPQLIGAVLLDATVDQPGWQETRKFTGRAYAQASGLVMHSGDASTLTSAVLLNRENVARVLGNVIASMQMLRDEISADDSDAVAEHLNRAREARERWWHKRQATDWSADDHPRMDASKRPSLFGNIFGLGRRKSPTSSK
ncbi:MAG: prephenate dehydrogenase/arogenate dehydrogenase family protein [Chloroflexota bacterium]|nr:prephenate dehydrogenase/arogenate dehydrogenase family protein [Chloroflexota bacterium]